MFLKTTNLLFVVVLSIAVVPLLAVIALTTNSAFAANPTAPTKVKSAVLYLPDNLMVERMGNDVQPLVKYIKAVEKEIDRFWLTQPVPNAKGVLVAVGIKPGKKARAWCEAVEGTIPPGTLRNFEQSLSRVATIDVQKGPIAFALNVELNGKQPTKFPFVPKVWMDTAKNPKARGIVPDGPFKVLWAD